MQNSCRFLADPMVDCRNAIVFRHACASAFFKLGSTRASSTW